MNSRAAHLLPFTATCHGLSSGLFVTSSGLVSCAVAPSPCPGSAHDRAIAPFESIFHPDSDHPSAVSYHGSKALYFLGCAVHSRVRRCHPLFLGHRRQCASCLHSP